MGNGGKRVILHGGSTVILSWNHQSQGIFLHLSQFFVIHHSGESSSVSSKRDMHGSWDVFQLSHHH